MTEFTLDTSGVVEGNPYVDMGDGQRFLAVGWAMLSPFEQGYVEALFASEEIRCALWERYGLIPPLAFSDLAPETLAAIRKIAERKHNTIEAGRDFWRFQQKGSFGLNYPPLTVSLGDDGKVRLA